jgi:AcrR family transcriptional regulator
MARPRSDIPQRVVAAARRQFLAAGVDGASLREIAKEAGTTVGMVYYYYPAKDDLFIAVVEETYRGLVADALALMARRGADDSFEARLQRLYARLWRLSDREFEVVRLLLREILTSSARVQRAAHLFLGGHLPALWQFLTDAREAGAVRGDLPPLAEVVAVMGLGMLPVIVSRVTIGGGLLGQPMLPPAEELAGAFSSMLLRGIGEGGQERKRRR